MEIGHTEDILCCNLNSDGTIHTNDSITTSRYTYVWDWWNNHYQYYWSYPAFIYEDKGKKALEIVKVLIQQKHISVKSVKQFIELQEKIMEVL